MEPDTLLTNAMIYLTAAVIAVPIAKRFGLGAVLGYLMAGIAIGPWGLRLISEVEDILHISEFGVVLLLFVIGLELEPKRLWAMRRQIFGWGAAQVVGVTAVLFAAALAFGIEWKTALIGSLGLSLSSTAIVLASLGERNLMATGAGGMAFALLLFQDMAAIPMIAIVPKLGDVAQVSGSGWIAVAKVIGVLLVLVYSSRHLVRPLMHLIAKAGVREISTSFALLLVIAIGLLMESVGMSMALGAFLAGVLLADSEYRHALEIDLEPFKGLLMGLFFIAVGMSIDFGVLLTHPLLILKLLLGFLVLKIAVLYVLGKAMGILVEQRLLFALMLSQGGEFAFVIFGAAAGVHVFGKETESMLMVIVALSMVTTPLLLVLYDKLVAPHFREARQRPDDDVSGQNEPVIIAGFGRFGQIIGRLLHANRIGVTVLDHDPDQIELVRKAGYKVFYGDATRMDLLRSAGIAKARMLVVAIDSVEDSLHLVDAVRKECPDLVILARARNVTHFYALMDRGVTVIERETFEGALQLGRKALQGLGFTPYQARRAAMKFRAHNIKNLYAVYPYYQDQQQVISLSAQAREELSAMFARDIYLPSDEQEDISWHD